MLLQWVRHVQTGAMSLVQVQRMNACLKSLQAKTKVCSALTCCFLAVPAHQCFSMIIAISIKSTIC